MINLSPYPPDCCGKVVDITTFGSKYHICRCLRCNKYYRTNFVISHVGFNYVEFDKKEVVWEEFDYEPNSYEKHIMDKLNINKVNLKFNCRFSNCSNIIKVKVDNEEEYFKLTCDRCRTELLYFRNAAIYNWIKDSQGYIYSVDCFYKEPNYSGFNDAIPIYDDTNKSGLEYKCYHCHLSYSNIPLPPGVILVQSK